VETNLTLHPNSFSDWLPRTPISARGSRTTGLYLLGSQACKPAPTGIILPHLPPLRAWLAVQNPCSRTAPTISGRPPCSLMHAHPPTARQAPAGLPGYPAHCHPILYPITAVTAARPPASFTPSTTVPFELPRSLIVHAVPFHPISAWRSLTEGSCATGEEEGASVMCWDGGRRGEHSV